MPKTSHHPDPALRAYINRIGGYSAFARQHNLNPRTAERIFSGAMPCPPRLREEIAAAEIKGHRLTAVWLNEQEGDQ